MEAKGVNRRRRRSSTKYTNIHKHADKYSDKKKERRDREIHTHIVATAHKIKRQR